MTWLYSEKFISLGEVIYIKFGPWLKGLYFNSGFNCILVWYVLGSWDGSVVIAIFVFTCLAFCYKLLLQVTGFKNYGYILATMFSLFIETETKFLSNMKQGLICCVHGRNWNGLSLIVKAQ